MKLSAAVLVLYVLGVAALLLPGSPFRGEDGSIVQSVVVVNIAMFISLLFAILGIVYGRQVGTIPRCRPSHPPWQTGSAPSPP